MTVGAAAVASPDKPSDARTKSPRLTYVICTAPGSGGASLASALQTTGVAGRPAEYFELERTAVPAKGEAYAQVDRIIAAATTPNGICGLTLHWHRFDAFRAILAQAFNARASTSSEAALSAWMEHTFGEQRYVWLRRRNKIAQAIAWYRAEAADAREPRGGRKDASAPPAVEFDFAEIDRRVEACRSFEIDWENHFRINRLKPLVLVYEELIKTYDETLAGTLRFLGIDVGSQPLALRPLLREDDAPPLEWEERYREFKAGHSSSAQTARAAGVADGTMATAPHRPPTISRARRNGGFDAAGPAPVTAAAVVKGAPPVSLAYLVCTVPRSGSTLLCDALTGTGLAGRPDEYFPPAIRTNLDRYWRRRLRVRDTRDYVDGVVREATTANGIFGAKVHWSQVDAFHKKLAACYPGAGDASFESLLRRKFPSVRYVWLRRRNVIAQGISYYRAWETGVWRSVKGRDDQESALAKSLDFDFDKIDRWVETVRQSNWQWEDYFVRHRIASLLVTYEDMVENLEATVRGVLQFLGVRGNDVVVATPEIERQANARSLEWEQRYREIKARHAPVVPHEAKSAVPPQQLPAAEPQQEQSVTEDAAISTEDGRISDLAAIISRKSVIRNHEREILSPRGTRNTWLVDLRKTFFDPVGVNLIAELFWERFADRFPFQVGGLEVGAVPMISAIQLHGLKRELRVNGFVVRKERKNYGLNKLYEGELTDDPIVVVDDLLNSAESVEKVRVVLSEVDRVIRDLFVVIDYENPRGQAWVNRSDTTFTALFTLPRFGLSLDQPRRPLVNQATFAAAWRFTASGGHYFDILPGSVPALDDGRLYFGSEDGKFRALDARTGEPVWEFEVETETRKKIRSSPAICRNEIYFGGYDGNVYCLDTATGAEKWRFSGADWVGSSPSLAPDLGELFIGLEHALARRQGGIAALNLATGEKIWEFPIPAYVHGSPVYDEKLGLLACGTNHRELLLFEPAARKLVWQFAAGGEIKAAAAFDHANKAVVVGAFDGSIHSIDLASGTSRWSVKTGNVIYSTPLVVGSRVYVASTDKHLYVVETESGSVVMRIAASGKLFSSPRLIAGRIYYGSTSGVVYEFDPHTDLITGQVQLPERVTDAIVHSDSSGLYYAKTYDGQIFAFRRVDDVS